MDFPLKRKTTQKPEIEVCILAGGLSTRMGRDKARLRLGRRTLLGHVRTAAEVSGFPVRVIRRDAVPRCGPLGGIYTALKSTRRDVIVFMSCDLPFVSSAIIRALARAAKANAQPIFFADREGMVGFPFALRKEALELITEQITRREFSLQKLARRLRAVARPIPATQAWRWFNVNTPEEFQRARELWRECRSTVRTAVR